MNEVYPLNDDAWLEWVEYRKQELRKKIGPIAQRKQTNFLMGYPPPVQQTIIDQSIMNSWQGLFAPKMNNRPAITQTNNTRTRSIEQDLNDTSWAYP